MNDETKVEVSICEQAIGKPYTGHATRKHGISRSFKGVIESCVKEGNSYRIGVKPALGLPSYFIVSHGQLAAL